MNRYQAQMWQWFRDLARHYYYDRVQNRRAFGERTGALNITLNFGFTATYFGNTCDARLEGSSLREFKNGATSTNMRFMRVVSSKLFSSLLCRRFFQHFALVFQIDRSASGSGSERQCLYKWQTIISVAFQPTN